MLGLDTYILNMITKWIDGAKTDEEALSRLRIFMGSSLVIHLTITALAGWSLYKFTKVKEKSTSDLIWPIVLLSVCLIIPVGNEKGEKLTNIPSLGLLVFATFVLTVITIVMWFIKKKPEEEMEEWGKSIK